MDVQDSQDPQPPILNILPIHVKQFRNIGSLVLRNIHGHCSYIKPQIKDRKEGYMDVQDRQDPHPPS